MVGFGLLGLVDECVHEAAWFVGLYCDSTVEKPSVGLFKGKTQPRTHCVVKPLAMQISKLPTTTKLHIDALTNQVTNAMRRIYVVNLHQADTAALIKQWSSLHRIPDAITEQIHKKAQGNPFVTQEMVRFSHRRFVG